MGDLIAGRYRIDAELRAVIDTPTDDWGVTVDRVEIKDIALPETMRRAMAHQAEAERDRRARVIAADGEYQASARLADAARVMADTPGALQLRLLQTVSDVTSEQNSTLVMPLPVELLRFFENATGTPGDRSGSASAAASPPLPPPLGPPAGHERPHTDGDEADGHAVTTDQDPGPR